MGLKLGTAALTLLLAICGAFTQTPTAVSNNAINGVWRGQVNGLPAIILVVTDEPGHLAGALQFYFQQRKTEKDPWIAEPRPAEPIFNLQFDGKTLLFEASHRRAHPPQSVNDPPKHYRLTLDGPNAAEILNLDEPGSPTLKLVRSEY